MSERALFGFTNLLVLRWYYVNDKINTCSGISLLKYLGTKYI